MSTYTQIRYQIVFGGKNFTFFLNEQNKEELFRYIYGVLQNQNCNPFIVGGHGNHIHCICSLHPTKCLSNIVKDIKMSSHEWMKKQGHKYGVFPGWQVGYGAFTYTKNATESLVQYVRKQKEHHNTRSFKKELCSLYDEHGIEYDERYFLI